MSEASHERPMNPLSFSTVACPGWSIERVIAAAGEYGYQGVELRTFGAGSTQLASDPALSDPDKIRHQFERAGVKMSCLATSAALHYRSRKEAAAALSSAKSFVEMAAALGCPRIRTFGYMIYPGEMPPAALRRIAGRYLELAEYAEESGVEIVIENAGSFARSRELWNLTNYVDHPLVGVCWNVAYAATVGERPGLSVTTLNSRIRYAKVKDTEVGQGTGYCALGEGTVEVERFVELMRGIGYEGWICFEWDKLWLPALAEPEETLPKARQTLHEWMRLKVDKKGKPLAKREAAVLEVRS
ncbi:MAG: sugar phosphate isomerase/epimerase [Phycisphaerales bacterium]|nr:sugar phosphate isomerase/epimerase [Phycisphaerales bacterium]